MVRTVGCSDGRALRTEGVVLKMDGQALMTGVPLRVERQALMMEGVTFRVDGRALRVDGRALTADGQALTAVGRALGGSYVRTEGQKQHYTCQPAIPRKPALTRYNVITEPLPLGAHTAVTVFPSPVLMNTYYMHHLYNKIIDHSLNK